MTKPSEENTYLQQVLEEQAAVDRQLKRARSAPPPAPAPGMAPVVSFGGGNLGGSSSSPKGVDYRITGFGLWKSVIVPPNVYTIHTRRGHPKPLHIGRGISFNFNPLTDAFLIIPSAVQTILINAKCICIERQGVLVQAYVQWIIDDIETAYWKLDFSDPEDPMEIVNLQLREQAEAAIKDKVSTLSIDEILSDKQPIIEELTHRLQTVAEGSSEISGESHSEGLGLKIVTVQIKEAVVSSTQLWQNLQAPFRAEREKIARLAQLESEREIKARELENRLVNDRSQLEAANTIEQLEAEQARVKYDREQAEALRRSQLEQDAERQVLAERNRTAQARNQAQLDLALQELALERQRITSEIEKVQVQMQLNTVQSEQALAQLNAQLQRETLTHEAEFNQRNRGLDLDQRQRLIENNLSPALLQSKWIEKLPEIASALPQPNEQRTTIITSENQAQVINPMLGFLSTMSTLMQDFFQRYSNSNANSNPNTDVNPSNINSP